MRTLLDLADVVSPDRVRQALDASVRQGKYDRDRMHAVLARGEGRRGLKVLRFLLTELEDDPPELRSPLEREFRDLLRAEGVPLPETNVVVEGVLVDCHWPEHGLVVELDSHGHHRSREKFESDHEQTEKLQNAGLTVRRFTREGVRGHPARVVQTVRKALQTR
jgi:very-short-patch-repair endonuclease